MKEWNNGEVGKRKIQTPRVSSMQEISFFGCCGWGKRKKFRNFRKGCVLEWSPPPSLLMGATVFLRFNLFSKSKIVGTWFRVPAEFSTKCGNKNNLPLDVEIALCWTSFPLFFSILLLISIDYGKKILTKKTVNYSKE